MHRKPNIRHIRAYRRLSTPKAAPDVLAIHPDLTAYSMRMHLIGISSSEFIEKEIFNPDEASNFLEKQTVTWLNVQGLSDAKKLLDIAKVFNLHKLSMDDVVHLHQRPKVESYNGITFAIVRMPIIINNELDLEQISIFWGKNFVVSFNEQQNNYLDSIVPEIQHDIYRQHLLTPQFLAFAIIDAVVDSFFPVLEKYGVRLDDIEEEAIVNPTPKIITAIHDFKRDLAAIRRTVWSQREAIRNISETNDINNQDLKYYIRDCEDHAIQLIDILESYRERASGLMDIYLSSINNRMNEVMRVLTIIATIFMPIGFVASLYGMNFDRGQAWNMPELGWKYGYLYCLALMLSMVSTLMFYFWRNGWLRKRYLG